MSKYLNRNEVNAAIHFEGPSRPVTAMLLWHNQETLDYYGTAFVKLLEMYPDDVMAVHIGIQYWQGKADDDNYRWAFRGWKKPSCSAVDNCPIISNWSQLDNFISDMPDPYRTDAMFPIVKARAAEPDRYILTNWGHYFHQRLAYLRGIENLLMDFYDHREHLQKIMDALISFYRIWAKRCADAGADGVWAGDDLGTQQSLFMHPDVFRAIYKPYYRKLAEILHENGLDFWLHTCGNVLEILGDIIETGVDVIHPIQAGSMDAITTLDRYSGRIAFWVGMDVQKLIPFCSPDQIRQDVMERAKVFYRPEGGLIIGAGNALIAGIPIENIKTYASTVEEFLNVYTCNGKISV